MYMETEKKWIRMSEVQELLKLNSRTTVCKFLKKYQIRASKPLRSPYFNKQDIINVLEMKSVKMGS